MIWLGVSTRGSLPDSFGHNLGFGFEDRQSKRLTLGEKSFSVRRTSNRSRHFAMRQRPAHDLRRSIATRLIGPVAIRWCHGPFACSTAVPLRPSWITVETGSGTRRARGCHGLEPRRVHPGPPS